MKDEIKYVLSLIALGCGLIGYAHATFATKSDVDSLLKIVERIDQRVYDIHTRFKEDR